MSNYRVGAVLDADGLEHLIAYLSRKLLDREQKYSTIEKECLAIKAFQMHFKCIYLASHLRVIQTDYRILQWLSNVKDENSCQQGQA